MLRALRNSWRLLRVALSFARHDALFPLEILGIAPALIAWARLFVWRRDSRRAAFGLIGLRSSAKQASGSFSCRRSAFSIRLSAAARASRVISAPASMRAISSRRSGAPSRETLVATRSPTPTSLLTIL